MRITLKLTLLSLISTSVFSLSNPEKVGIGTWEVGKQGVSLTKLNQINFSWHYNWRTDPLWSPKSNRGDSVFYPMIWATKNVGEKIPARSSVLLTFNEPDHHDQANMTVDKAIELWPKLEKYNKPLCSPAPTTHGALRYSWLSNFMEKAKKKNLRVDYICLHFYSDNKSVSEFKKYLETAYQLYKKPILLTEWGLVDWRSQKKFTQKEMAAFIKDSLEMLDGLSFIKKHAWFSGPKYDAYHDIGTHLHTKNGDLTPIGQLFKTVLK